MLDAQTQNAENGDFDAPQSNSMAAFSDKMQDLADALDILYISGNPSGRNKFREQWPDIALYLFGDDLIRYDNEGCDDRAHRQKLEESAMDKRLLLKATIADLVDKSVDAGMLQMEYVGKVIDAFGSCVSKYLYAENIIERVRPGLMARTQDEKDAKVEAEQASKEAAESAVPPAPAPEDKQEAVTEVETPSVVVQTGSQAEEVATANAVQAEIQPEPQEETVAKALAATVEVSDSEVVSDVGDVSEDELERQRFAEEKSIFSNREEEAEEVVSEPEEAEKPTKPKLEIKGMPPIADDIFDDVMPIDTSVPASEAGAAAEEDIESAEDSAEEESAAVSEIRSDEIEQEEKGDVSPSSESDPAAIAASLLGGGAPSPQQPETSDTEVDGNDAAPAQEESADDVQASDEPAESAKPLPGTYKAIFNALASAS